MLYFAKINPITLTVENVIIAEKEFIDQLPDSNLWIQTTNNVEGDVYYDPNTNEFSSDKTNIFRKNSANKNFKYDPVKDVFIPPKQFKSWILDEETCLWNSPVPKPNDGKRYFWNEETQTWDEMIT
jgi:hypothetical protein